MTVSRLPGSVGHLFTVVTKCALPSPVAGRSTISMFTSTGCSVSAQQSFWVKNVYRWFHTLSTEISALRFHASVSAGVQLNCSGVYVAAVAGPPTDATQSGSAGLPLAKLNAIPTVMVRLPSPGA